MIGWVGHSRVRAAWGLGITEKSYCLEQQRKRVQGDLGGRDRMRAATNPPAET